MIDLGKREVDALRLALQLAIEWERAGIDAYTTKPRKGRPLAPKIVDAENRPTVMKMSRNIRRFRELLGRLR